MLSTDLKPNRYNLESVIVDRTSSKSKVRPNTVVLCDVNGIGPNCILNLDGKLEFTDKQIKKIIGIIEHRERVAFEKGQLQARLAVKEALGIYDKEDDYELQ